MKLVIGADSFAYPLKKALAKHLSERGFEIVDVDGYSEIPYYDVAEQSAKMIAVGEVDAGILLCGTGAGMCIVANKIKGVKAVCVESVFAAEKAKAINNANVITMGSMIVAEALACSIADAWLDAKFAQGFESIKDFLQSAFDSVSQIDSKNRRA